MMKVIHPKRFTSLAKPIVQMDSRTLFVRYPTTKVFPFQMAAVPMPSTSILINGQTRSKLIAAEAKNQMTASKWKGMSPEEQDA